MRRPALRLRSVRVRLTLWNVGVLALVLVVLGVALRAVVLNNLLGAMDRDMARRMHRITDNPPPQPAPQPARSEQGHSPRLFDGRRRFQDGNHRGGGFGPRLLGLNGQNIFPGWPDGPWDINGFRAAVGGRQEVSTVVRGGGLLRVLSVPLRRDGRIVGVAQDAQPLDGITQEVDRLTRTLLTLLPLALLTAGIGGAFLTDRALRPVRDITRAAGRIGAQNLSGRLPVAGDDELAALAITFNAVLARLEAAFEQQRRFTADASHELRTPLTVIKAQSSLALSAPRDAGGYREALEAIDRAADRTGRLVQDLLLLARADAGQSGFARTPTPLTDVLEQAVAAIAATGGPPIEVHCPAALCVPGDAEALIRLFSNLLTNAVRHTPPGGRITVSAESQADGAAITVADTGEGIPPEHLPHVFERFYRADAARSRRQGGTGLGLAIGKSIVDSHGGTMTIESTVGHGTTVRVLLPRI